MVNIDAGEQHEIQEQRHQQEEEGQQQLPYQLTHYYNNALAVFEREFNEWRQHEYNHPRLLFEVEQQEAYQRALTLLPALHQPQEEHQ